MSNAKWPSLTGMFFAQAGRLGVKPLLWHKQAGEWRSQSWDETAQQVRHLARGLSALGVGDGDRVVLASENRPEWCIADLAIMAAGAITVPAYVTNTVADHVHILNDCDARAVIVSTRTLAERIIAAGLKARRAPLVVVIEDLALTQHSGLAVHRWEAVQALGAESPDRVDATVATMTRADTACLIYTSGTGGAPKGVMTSHGAILHNCEGAYVLLEQLGLSDEVFLSFLPLSHSYEHTAGQFFPLFLGAQIYYAEGIEHLAANMAEVKPTLIMAVPRLYEAMRAKILKGVERAGGRKQALFLKAVELGTRRQEGGRLTLWERAQDLALERLVRAKVGMRFGGRLKAFVSGGAPLNYDVGMFFSALGVRILQGYGLTEAGPVISVNVPHRVRMATVGPVLGDQQVKIAEDGEILVKGENVMQGYWANPEATRAAIDAEGWLHTGDIGEFDDGHYLRITDRKKDLIVNSGGDNISPQRVEGVLTLQPEIAQAMVHGDRRPHLVALLVPDEDWAKGWAATHGKAPELSALIDEPEFRRAVGAAVDRVNRDLSGIEKVRRFTLSAEPFSVTNGMCTPTMKIRRHVIRQVWGPRLESLYDERRH